MAYYVGVDFGGTNIKTGIVDEHGKVLSRLSIPTEADQGVDHVIARLAKGAFDAMDQAGVSKSDVAALGVGAPGTMSHKDGVIIRPPNIPHWKNVPLRDLLRKATGIPTNMDNDANAAAWGEFWAGAGKHVTDMVMFTLGTGVGGGIITDGRLARGYFDNGAELGHIIVKPGGLPCGCGQRGCLETYSAASHVAKRARIAVESGESSLLRQVLVEEKRSIECVDVAEAARQGDIVADRIWDEACMYLAVACVMMQHTTNPAQIVLAGGMIAAGDQLLLTIRRHFDWLTWRLVEDQPEIMLASLGNDAGLIGAAGCAKTALENDEIVTEK